MTTTTSGSAAQPIWRTGRFKASAAMMGSAACWGLATVMSRDLLSGMTSSALLVVQLAASVTVLVAMSLARAPWRIRSPAFAMAVSLGLLEPGLTYSFALVGLSLTTAGNASIIAASEPLLIVLANWLIFRHRPSRAMLICTGGAVLGILLVSGQAWSGGRGASIVGVLLLIVSTFFAALYVVLSSRVVVAFPASSLAAGQQIIGLLFATAVLGLVEALGLEHQDWAQIHPSRLLYAACSGIVQYALAFWLYIIGLKHATANSAGLWLALTPIFGLAGAYLWLGEVPAQAALSGTALIVGAVWFHQLHPERD